MVGRSRKLNDRATGQSQTELDAFLLRKFPGRTLDELDQMDWPRFLRAMEAEAIIRVEEKRSAFFRGDVKTMSEDEWTMIVEHDELVKRWQTG